MKRTAILAPALALLAATALPWSSSVHAATFSTGTECVAPENFGVRERLTLGDMVDNAAEIELHWNTVILGMSKEDFKAGKRWLRVEFDCPSLGALAATDDDRRPQLKALLSTDARSAVMTGARRYKEAFKDLVEVLIVGADAALDSGEATASLDGKKLRITRSNFTSGGWTDADWKDWLGNNLKAGTVTSNGLPEFSSGKACSKPEGFSQSEWQTLEDEVGVASESEERWNVTYLGMSKKAFKAGERMVRIEFDCASLQHLMPAKDNRVGQIRALLSRDARGAIQTAGRRFKKKFDREVDTVIIAAHENGEPKETLVTLKKGVLRISRVNFVSGGMTDFDWREWFEQNL